MADLRPVQSYINLDAIDAENDAMVKKVKETVSAILSEFKKTKGIELKLAADPASAKQIRQAIEDLQKAQKGLEKSTLDLNKIRSAQIKQDILASKSAAEHSRSLKAEAQATESATRAKIQEVKYTTALTKEKERLAKQEEKSRKELEKSLNAYELLKKKYNDTANNAKRLGAELGVQSAEFKAASTQALAYWKSLDEIETSVGQAQRRVGQYERAQFSLNQVLREAPAFVNSLQTGFMAISNNLPMLSDEFNRLRQSGLTSFQALKVFATGLFSIQTGISVGVTLLTAYGDDIVRFVENLAKVPTAFDKAKESQRILTEAMDEGSGSYLEASRTVSKLRIDIDLAKKGLIDKKTVVNEYNETIGKATGEVSSLDEAEKSLIKNGPAYVKMMLYMAAANVALKESAQKAVEAEKTRMKDIKEFDGAFGKLGRSLNSLGNLGSDPEGQRLAEENNKKAISDQNRLSTERKEATAKTFDDEAGALEKIASDFEAKSREIAQKFNFTVPGEGDSKSQKSKFFDDEIKAQSEGYKKIAEGQELFITSRIEARKKAFELDKQIIEGNRAAELENAGKDEQAKLDINRKASFELKQLRSQLYSDLLTIQRTYQDRRTALDEQINSDAQEQFLKQENDRTAAAVEIESIRLDKRKASLEEARDIELNALEKKRVSEKISEQAYQRERLRIETDYTGFLLKAEIEYTEAVIKLAKARGEDVSRQEADLVALKLEFSRLGTDTQIKNLLEVDKVEKDLLKEKKKRYEDLAKDLINIFSTLATAGFDREKNAIQEQIVLLDEKKQKDIETANATIQNEQDRAAAITTINARSLAQKEKLQQQQKDLDVRKARFEKLASVISIEIDTIQKVAAIKAQAALLLANPLTAPLATLALSQIPIVIAGGALSAAAILAKPIPKYRFGTMDHPGGEAIVGDGGKREVVITPDGRMMLTPDIPTLMDLPARSVVLPDTESANRLLDNSINKSIFSSNEVARSGGIIDAGLKQEMIRFRVDAVSLLKRIEEKETLQPYIKDGDIRAMLRKGASWVNYLNGRL